jgi:acyl dehydratase
VAIGHSTVATQRVKGNLFYRRVQLLRPVHIGDTLTTRSEVVALRQNRPKPGRPATGLVALRIQVENQRNKPVLDFWRCPMIPLRDPERDTGHADSFDDIPADIDLDLLSSKVPWGWRLSTFKDRVGRAGAHFADVAPGTTFTIEGRDTVTGATELARATLNLASTHTDPAACTYGRRLVYGGHTISLAGAAATRALPNLVTILGWRSCEHTGPVFEGDVLRTEITVDAAHPLTQGGMVDLHALVWADRAARGTGGVPPTAAAGAAKDRSGEEAVLDWRFIALMA